jgi:hypothetical protein
MLQARRESLFAEQALIMVGGVHCNFFPESSLTDFNADLAANGESEETILEILERGARRDFAGIPGILWRSPGGEAHRNPARPLTRDISQLPLPARHLLPADLAGSPDWTQDGTWRGCQAWRHARGTRVLVPAAGRYSDDGEILDEAAATVARVSLGIAPGDLRTAVTRLAAVLAAHHPAAASPHRCRCGLPHPCPAFRAAAGLPPGKPRPLGTRTHPR